MNNDYDKFAKERQVELITGTKLPHKYVEKPMMKAMMPKVKGKKVLLLGCGTGEETKLLEEFGVSDMIGIDLSKVSIDIANETYLKYKFIVGDMHHLPFEDASFDFVYSSLTIHYSPNPVEVFKEIFRVLKPKGKLLFSVGHPIRWASEEMMINGEKYRITGFKTDKNKSQSNIGNYLSFSLHSHNFPHGEVLEFYSAPPSMYFKFLKDTKFKVLDFVESKCVEEAIEVDKDYYNRYSELPQFIGFLAEK